MKYTGKRWTLSEVKAANERGGGCFFSRDTMRFFGDTMQSFRLEHVMEDGEPVIYLRRVRPMRDRDGRNMGGVGDRRVFDQATGDIGLPVKTEALHSACACTVHRHEPSCPWYREGR